MYKSNPIGHEFTIIIFGVDIKLLNDPKKLKKLLEDSAKEENYTILNSFDYKFSPQGVSVTVMISESHLCIHTYPEYNSLVFNFYTCRGENDGEKTVNFLRKKIKHTRFIVNERKIIVDQNKLIKI
ncbi:MAG: adenosylmethionine decarboxylase [Nanoarchaeota archaeon]|nr:adenosylmethionine decarboxylase [Nanoarchaeota archaeon]